jgi:hypothetical protein
MASATARPLAARPAARIFPLISGDEFEALVADIREHGQREPIKVDRDGRVLDGRNRLRACRRLGIEPRVERVDVDADDAVALVLSPNLVRRHLASAQRAFVALELQKCRSSTRRKPRATAWIAQFSTTLPSTLLRIQAVFVVTSAWLDTARPTRAGLFGVVKVVWKTPPNVMPPVRKCGESPRNTAPWKPGTGAKRVLAVQSMKMKAPEPLGAKTSHVRVSPSRRLPMSIIFVVAVAASTRSVGALAVPTLTTSRIASWPCQRLRFSVLLTSGMFVPSR